MSPIDSLLKRRARTLACHTRMRAGFPRHASIAGDRPPRYGPLDVIVGRWDNLSLAMHRSREKPARMRVWHPRAPALRAFGHYRRAWACPSPCHARGGQAPALRAFGRYRRVLGKPVPRHVLFAGDRPPRYGPRGRGSRLRQPDALPRLRVCLTQERFPPLLQTALAAQ